MGDHSDDAVPIALTGVVHVKVNDSNGPIERGDFLTTSAIEGQAMRADRAEAGSIIGKALEDMPEGSASILVFINIQ